MPFLVGTHGVEAVHGCLGICFLTPSTEPTDMITKDITTIALAEAGMVDMVMDGPAVTEDFPAAAEASVAIAEVSAAAAVTAAEDSPAAEEAADKQRKL